MPARAASTDRPCGQHPPGIPPPPPDLQSRMTRRPRSAFQAILLTVALSIFWIASVASLRLHELLIGIPAVLISVAFCLFTVRTLPLRFRPTLAELAEIRSLPWYVALDVAEVVAVLFRSFTGAHIPSLFRSVPWRKNAESARATAARVLATAYTTVSPNCIVIGIDRDRRQVLFHQLRRAPLPPATRRLGAGDAP